MIFFLIGAFIGTLVCLFCEIKNKKFSWRNLIFRFFILLLLILGVFLIPSKAHAWCEKCKPIPYKFHESILKLYREQGERAEELILQIKELTDQYAFNGEDAFMTSVGTGMASFGEEGPIASAVAIILANSAVYFCKTCQCHWKTVYLMNELHFRLFYFKKLGEEIIHTRWMCLDCYNTYFMFNFWGDKRIYLAIYPLCALEEDGCSD